MRGRALTVMFALSMLMLGVACSDDSETRRPDQRTTQSDGRVTQLDSKVMPPDQSPDISKPAPVGCTTPRKATANSGKICKSAADCTSDEVCLDGLCRGTCCRDTTKPTTDPANLCPVADSTTQLSACDTEIRDPETNVITGHACTWFCGYWIDGAHKQFKCPDDTSFDCKADSPAAPTPISTCVPK